MKKIYLVLGIVLILVTSIVMSGIDNERVININEKCETTVGDIAKFFSDEVTMNCREAKNKMILVNYGALGYFIGGILIVISLFYGRKTKKEKYEHEDKIREKREEKEQK